MLQTMGKLDFKKNFRIQMSFALWKVTKTIYASHHNWV